MKAFWRAGWAYFHPHPKDAFPLSLLSNTNEQKASVSALPSTLQQGNA